MRGLIVTASVVLCLTGCDREKPDDLPQTQPRPGSQRLIAYTDKGDAFWVTRSGGYPTQARRGLTASKRPYLADIFIQANGNLLPREEAVVTVNPLQLVRHYPKLGLTETWILLDTCRTLILQLESSANTDWTFQPAIYGGSQDEDFEIEAAATSLKIRIPTLVDRHSAYPNLQFHFSDPVEWKASQRPEFSLFNAWLTPAAQLNAATRVTVVFNLSRDDWLAPLSESEINERIQSRHERLTQRLKRTEFNSNLPQLNTALPWVHASLDALIMNQQGRGIYAGLPWFDDYWGRDIFISFIGATLVSGEFKAARDILTSFAKFQNQDPESRNYGRIPNRAQPEDIIYNTTDGTAWFVRSVWEYYRYSGDREFLGEMWPVVRRATEGAIKNWVDKYGFLSHDDADTWMDAKTEAGAWSPRGNRAIEIQFLWRDQLEVTRHLAALNNVKSVQQQCAALIHKLNQNLDMFRDTTTGAYVDHLNADGSRDKQIRPNVFLVPPLFEETIDWTTFNELAPSLITHQGVLSLSQDDPEFHPYHHRPALYVQDAAYHNGIIWTWNSATAISAANRFNQYQYVESLFTNLTDQVLNRGAIGTISELTDAWPSHNKTQLSGTFSQAWSLAEYLRIFYQDILGIKPDLSQMKVNLAPRLIEGMTEVTVPVFIGKDRWTINYTDQPGAFLVDLKRTQTVPVQVNLNLRNGTFESMLEFEWSTETMNLRFEKKMGQWTVPDAAGEYQLVSGEIQNPINSLAFCEIDTSIAVPALQGPAHRLLRPAEVLPEEMNVVWHVKSDDPAADNRGSNRKYVPPLNPIFKEGSTDLLSFSMGSTPRSFVFSLDFADLVDPGWHPEYGFQLTYCVLGISTKPSTGVRNIGRNAGDRFQNGFRADYMIYISGALQLVAATGEIIAEYKPETEREAVGHADTDRIRFALPRELFEADLQRADYQVVAGYQDDHGGAGIGDFREVQELPAEWLGGGAYSGSDSNVYDWLSLQ